jgi:hypothetical protein
MTGNSWFTVKVKYTKQQENGTFKRVSEPYLLSAISFSDAEARIYEELGSTIRGEFLVTGIARTEIHDIFAYDDADVWYKAVISYDKMDDEGDKKKKIKQTFLVSAESVKEANDRIVENLSTLMIDYTIDGVTVTPLVDIFPFVDSEDTNQLIDAGDDLGDVNSSQNTEFIVNEGENKFFDPNQKKYTVELEDQD